MRVTTEMVYESNKLIGMNVAIVNVDFTDLYGDKLKEFYAKIARNLNLQLAFSGLPGEFATAAYDNDFGMLTSVPVIVYFDDSNEDVQVFYFANYVFELETEKWANNEKVFFRAVVN